MNAEHCSTAAGSNYEDVSANGYVIVFYEIDKLYWYVYWSY